MKIRVKSTQNNGFSAKNQIFTSFSKTIDLRTGDNFLSKKQRFNIASIVFIAIFFILLPWVFVVRRKLILQPDKPWITCILNVFLLPLKKLRIGPFKHKFDAASALRGAMKACKVTNVGSDSKFLENYTDILHGPAFTSSEFCCLGLISAQKELVEAFKRRLRGQQFLDSHLDDMNVPMKRPIFVVGLPRTGTTFLHRLLSLDPNCRAPLTWELFSPYPLTSSSDLEELNADRINRRKYTDKNIKQMQQFGGESLKAIHEVGTDLPEECLISLTNDIPVLFSLLNSCFIEYERFVNMECDSAYARHKQVLQTLAWQIGEGRNGSFSRRWVLKCPIHLMFIDSIARVFPDAVIVYTHRTPVDAVSSLASLNRALHSSFYEPWTFNAAATGQASLAWASYSYNKAMKDLDASQLQCVHVKYDELISRPKEVLLQTLNKIDGITAIPAEFDKRLDEFLRADKEKRNVEKGKKKKLHSYNPRDFGLTKEGIEEEMKGYMQKFGFSGK